MCPGIRNWACPHNYLQSLLCSHLCNNFNEGYKYMYVVLWPSFQPPHEIMALFVLRKLILQTRMRSHPVRLDIWFLVRSFVYFHTLCVLTAKAVLRLRGCAGSHQPSLVAYAISTIISWAGSFLLFHKASLHVKRAMLGVEHGISRARVLIPCNCYSSGYMTYTLHIFGYLFHTS